MARSAEAIVHRQPPPPPVRQPRDVRFLRRIPAPHPMSPPRVVPHLPRRQPAMRPQRPAGWCRKGGCRKGGCRKGDVALIHPQRWHAHRNTAGSGHLYQGRFKSFVVESNEHLFSLGRYVERNALRASLVERAEDWRWSSLWRLVHGDGDARSPLSDWPIPRPRDWLKRVNRALTAAELKALRHCLQRGTPYGNPDWVERTARELGIETTLRPRGRPRKKKRS